MRMLFLRKNPSGSIKLEFCSLLEDFKTFYFDTALATNEATLSAMEKFVGPDRVLFGTDYCGAPPSVIRTGLGAFG